MIWYWRWCLWSLILPNVDFLSYSFLSRILFWLVKISTSTVPHLDISSRVSNIMFLSDLFTSYAKKYLSESFLTQLKWFTQYLYRNYQKEFYQSCKVVIFEHWKWLIHNSVTIEVDQWSKKYFGSGANLIQFISTSYSKTLQTSTDIYKNFYINCPYS